MQLRCLALQKIIHDDQKIYSRKLYSLNLFGAITEIVYLCTRRIKDRAPAFMG